MSTERAISESTTLYSRELGPEPLRDTACDPTDLTGYPPAPSAAVCAALIPCRHNAQGCPLGVDIPSIARALAGGNREAAFRVVRAAHPFPSTCGGGCYAPCESVCRRRPFGAPVAISTLEEFAASFAAPMLAAPSGPCTSRFEARSVGGAIGRSPELALAAARSGKTVAIVGAGPAGLACAHDLTLLGHRATLYDTRAEPGGLITGGIPPFRFPVGGARAECDALLGPHVEFRGGASITGLRTLLDSGRDAVFLAVGASRPATSPLQSAHQHADVLDAMDVLTGDVGPRGETIVAGEGALAIDAARTLARRAGAGQNGASVQLVLTASLDEGIATPALLASCARDGIRIHHDWYVRRVHVDSESGLLASIDLAAPHGTSARVLACDRLVLAAPRIPDVSRFGGGLELTREGFVATDPQTLRTSMANVWAGGACAFGHRSIAHAVADGKRAAWQIHASLTGARVATTFASAWVDANGRGKPERLPAQRRRALPLFEPPPADPFAPATPRAAAHAGEEAARCFDCSQIPVVTGECTSCGRCVDRCPTGAITFVDKRLAIESEVCNRCGVCTTACPEGALTMLRAEWEERLRFERPPVGLPPGDHAVLSA